MKSVFVLFTIWSLAAAATAADLDSPRIAVYGTATTEAVPDLMLWYVAVKTEASGLEQAADDHTKHLAAVLEVLRQHGIASKDCQTSSTELDENWERRDDRRVKVGYRAATMVHFRCLDLTKYRELWLGLSRVPQVSIEDVSWDTTKRAELRNSTRIEAVKAARTKAQELAEALSVDVGDPLSIEEEIVGSHGYSASSNTTIESDDFDPTEDSSMAPGRVPVRARVHVVFRLEKRK